MSPKPLRSAAAIIALSLAASNTSAQSSPSSRDVARSALPTEQAAARDTTPTRVTMNLDGWGVQSPECNPRGNDLECVVHIMNNRSERFGVRLENVVALNAEDVTVGRAKDFDYAPSPRAGSSSTEAACNVGQLCYVRFRLPKTSKAITFTLSTWDPGTDWTKVMDSDRTTLPLVVGDKK